MMGASHVLLNTNLGLVSLPATGLTDPRQQAAWVAVWAGAGLAPDLDVAGSTASRMWGPISQGASARINQIAGGHRRGTHDVVLAPLAAAAITIICSLWTVTAFVGLVVLAGLILRASRRRAAGIGCLVASVAAAAAAIQAGFQIPGLLLAAAVAGGVLGHCLGDGITTERLPVPLVWLKGSRARFGLALFDTGSTVERRIVAPLLTLTAVWLAGSHIHMWLPLSII